MNRALNKICESLYLEAVQLFKNCDSWVHHKVACAAWSESAGVFLGINMKTSGMSHCAEVTAIGSAMVRGVSDLSLIIAVFRTPAGDYQVILPCGNCRQLMADYYPAMRIVVSVRPTVALIRLEELLPQPLLLTELSNLKLNSTLPFSGEPTQPRGCQPARQRVRRA